MAWVWKWKNRYYYSSFWIIPWVPTKNPAIYIRGTVLWPSSSPTSSRQRHCSRIFGPQRKEQSGGAFPPVPRFGSIPLFNSPPSQDTTINSDTTKEKAIREAAAYTPNVTSGMGDAASNHPVSPFLLNFLSVNQLLVAAGCSCPRPAGRNLDLVAAATREIACLKSFRFVAGREILAGEWHLCSVSGSCATKWLWTVELGRQPWRRRRWVHRPRRRRTLVARRRRPGNGSGGGAPGLDSPDTSKSRNTADPALSTKLAGGRRRYAFSRFMYLVFYLNRAVNATAGGEVAVEEGIRPEAGRRRR
jgi:hypothetical protein